MAIPLSTAERTNQNGLVLANAAELIAAIIARIAGNDISTSINGARATTEIIESIAFQRITKLLGGQ